MDPFDVGEVRARLDRVREQIESACRRVDRDPASVRIVAVSKGFGPEAVEAVRRCGHLCFGENRVQEARQKIPACGGDLEWHMVGHLQSNKVRDVVRLFSMIHSVDSLDLLRRVDREAGEAGRHLSVCLQVNVSGERSKSGMPVEQVGQVLAEGLSLMHVEIVGLMTIPPFDPDPEAARPLFRRLAGLRDTYGRGQTGGLGLSIGMSGDLEVAVEEGATWVRVGRAIFGNRPKRVVREAADT